MKGKYISVQYLSKAMTGIMVDDYSNINPALNPFSGREYTYITELDLKVGDIVYAPTQSGDRIARVACIDVPDSKIDERIMQLLKTIESVYVPPLKPEVKPDAEIPTVSVADL